MLGRGASQGEKGPPAFLKARGTPRKKEAFAMIYTLKTAEKLAGLNAVDLRGGDLAQILGRNSPGDGQWLYRWEPQSGAAPNGGTVLAPADAGRAGRWLLCHNGTVSLGCFGVFGPQTPADAALDALMADESVTRIQICSDINLTRRHTFTRGHVTLDFGGHRLTANGVEPAKHNDPFGALMHFTGTLGAERLEYRLSEPVGELYDLFEVPQARELPLYSWWRVSVNNLSGREEKEIDKLLCVTEHIDDTHVRVNYKMGWPLAAGRTLTWQRIYPVEGVTVQNMEFWGNEGGEATGAQPLALEYAVRCNVRDLHARHTYWPVLLRRHNTEYVTERCSLYNPVEVVVGGTGYLTQQIHCLYGTVRDCTVSNARHLNDFTGSAYCMVENCHGDGDFHGAFVTHGQFEHDLAYVGNSGLLSFANSGPTWGSSAKRITVVRHTGCWGLGFAKVSDLTLQDVAIHKTEKYPQCGNFLLNADGLQMRGCTGDALVLTQRSRRSRRPTLVEGCWFREGITVERGGEGAVAEDTPLVFQNNLSQTGEE